MSLAMARKRRRKAPPPLPILLTELALASAETIARRTMLMAQGRCSSREQRRMFEEKSRAALTSLALMTRSGVDAPALLAPWHSAATANAKRLRKRRR
jgi:hypothetical protein